MPLSLKRYIVGISLIGALAGCGTLPQVSPGETLVLAPPASLTLPCPSPAYPLETTGDLARGLLAEREALRECDRRMQALRDWGREALREWGWEARNGAWEATE